MTKYYVGYLQGNGGYVYVTIVMNNIINIAVTASNSTICFDDEKTAKALLSVCKAIDPDKDYKVLKITTDIEEV